MVIDITPEDTLHTYFSDKPGGVTWPFTAYFSPTQSAAGPRCPKHTLLVSRELTTG